jgi:hypothetical protein
MLPPNNPAFAASTATADGFTAQINNYDVKFTYSGTATAGGTVAISVSGLVTVTGVAVGASSTATITTTRLGYADGSAQVTKTSPATSSTNISQYPGGGAAFTAIVQNGQVTEILITDQGYGYGTVTTDGNSVFTQVSRDVVLSIEPPPSGTTATATAQCSILQIRPTATAEEVADFNPPECSVAYAIKTGAMELINDQNADPKNTLQDRSVAVVYRPTATTCTLNLREYFNNSISPRSNVMARDRGTGFVEDVTAARTRLDMAFNRSALGTATGVAQARFASRKYADMAGADRHLAVELSGDSVPASATDATPPVPLIYALEVNGVLGDGG